MRLLYSRHLEHFLAVCEAQSLRKAAEVCGVTQPALTKSLQILESALAVQLFERRASGVVPTPAAQILRRHGQHIINSSRFIEMELAMLRDGRAGTLRIGSGVVWSVSLMPELLAALHRRYPKLEVTLQSGLAEQLLPQLLEGQLDVVFGQIPSTALPEGYSVQELPGSDVILLARQGHPLAREGPPVAMAELARYDFIGFTADVDARTRTQQRFVDAGLPAPRTVLRSSSLETLLATVAASDSLTVLATVLADRAAEAGLVPLRLEAPLWRIRLGICYRTQSAELTPLKVLIEMAVEMTTARQGFDQRYSMRS